ncbi:hypothetical protein LOTGIDRAFT_163122 [Lottia gigantea]|uniref:ZMYM2-like/QRICH1 C-terminal domain-containing protein n=1 Tax=Lottia gigantea TaxID=225164 RepID=V4BS74_LOTGI|nr:hypothetical protein LOTGIDRAFT_163122 [Lottia gigantea]ESO91764.1 hypothetical protein LOTGIDRAFT_163122 [Lottia gigantea]
MTRAYENSNPLRCPVRLHEKYIALRPKNGTVDAFYLRPMKMPCSDVWYCDSPVGIHTIQSTVKRLCQSAGIIGNFSNHSLRATAATRLYQAGVDEQLITEKTGHRSNAVRAYKRTSDAQQASVSSVLHSGSKKHKLEELVDTSPTKFKQERCVNEETSDKEHKELREFKLSMPGMNLSMKFDSFDCSIASKIAIICLF